MKQEIKNFDRMNLFKHYNDMTNPFATITIRLDVTKLYKLCKKMKSHYATIGYYVVRAMNQIENFKYRYENGKIYKYNDLNAGFTQMFADGNIGFFSVEMKDNVEDFVKEFKRIESKFLKENKSLSGKSQGEVWLSCEPWFNITSLTPVYDKNIAIPQVIWDRFCLENDKCYLHFMIMMHHGFADGSHLGKFINNLEKLIEEIEC